MQIVFLHVEASNSRFAHRRFDGIDLLNDQQSGVLHTTADMVSA